MNILILGGTGVISTAVVRLCVGKGYKVTCINRGKRKNDNDDLDINIFICNLITEKNKFQSFLIGKNYDVVVDFLCYSGATLKSHLEMLKGHVKQYVLISTDSVYKIKKSDIVYSENDELGNTIWRYSTGKVECEDFLRNNHNEYGVEYTIVRPAVTFGNTRIPYGLMPKEGYHYFLIDRIRTGKYIPVWNDGLNVSTIIRSEDFAKLFVPLLGNEKAYSEVFNVCGNEFVSNRDVLNWVGDIIGKKARTVNLKVDEITKVFRDRVGEFAVDRAFDHKVMNTKIKDFTGEEVDISVRKGIENSINYYENNNYCSDVDYFFEGQLDCLINKYGNVSERQIFVNYRGDERAHRKEYNKGYKSNSFIVNYPKQIKKYITSIPKRVIAKLRYFVTGHY